MYSHTKLIYKQYINPFYYFTVNLRIRLNELWIQTIQKAFNDQILFYVQNTYCVTKQNVTVPCTVFKKTNIAVSSFTSYTMTKLII